MIKMHLFSNIFDIVENLIKINRDKDGRQVKGAKIEEELRIRS